MRIGLITQLSGRPGGDREYSWSSVKSAAMTAERVGFDMFVFEDALMYRGDDGTDGVWESMAIAGAVAASTSSIQFGQSVVNAPYRSPALIASIATTLDEISGGRYVLGIGAGNTSDSDYEGFGFPTDHRYSRFAETIKIVHTLLRTGAADFVGEYYSAKQAELVLRGPSPYGPEINIAAAGPRMLDLVARYADTWNWYTWDETVDDAVANLAPIIQRLDTACEQIGRDPGSVRRTLDFYSITPPGLEPDSWIASRMTQPLTGDDGELVEALLRFGGLGFDEVRCDLTVKTIDGIEAFDPVVRELQNG